VSEWSLLDYVPRPDFDSQVLGNEQALEKPFAPNITTFNWQLTIQGLSYRASFPTDYLSISVLLGHILLALGHTIWLLYRRQSSGCWDTITELVTLAQNSRPAHKVLKNTSTGIKYLGTFAKVGKIRVVREDNLENEHTTSPVPHIELVFREGKNPREEGHLPRSEHKTARVSSIKTWPLIRRKAAVSTRDSGAGSRHGVSSSQTLLLRPLKGNGQNPEDSDYVSCREVAVEDFERVHPDQLYD
jgi:hypothetical protein